MPRVTITVPDKTAQPYRFQLDRQVVTMGRGSENDIAIDSGSVSVNHAEMRRIDGGYELRDTGSTNGIKLDGVRHEVIPLTSGITVKLGDVAFDFLLSDEELGSLSREQRAVELPLSRATPNDLPPIQESAADKIARQRATYAPAGSGGVGFGSVVMFLILAAAAFFAGLAVRHQKETGRALIEDMQSKFAVRKTIYVPSEGTKSPDK